MVLEVCMGGLDSMEVFMVGMEEGMPEPLFSQRALAAGRTSSVVEKHVSESGLLYTYVSRTRLNRE